MILMLKRIGRPVLFFCQKVSKDIKIGFDDARRIAEEGLPLLKIGVLLHGDYCLPNILLDDWKFSGYINLVNGGMGDRHIDILWGITNSSLWTCL